MPKSSSTGQGEKRGVEAMPLPRFRRIEELKDYLTERGLTLEHLRNARNNVTRRTEFVEALRKSGVNGQAEKLASYLPRVGQEFERKTSFLEKAGSVLKAPFKWTWEAAKRHPYITAAVIVALLGIAAYYTGVGPAVIGRIKAWIASKFGVGALGKAAETAGEAAEAAKDAAGGLIEKIPEITPTPSPMPPPTPLPTEVIETLDQLFKGK